MQCFEKIITITKQLPSLKIDLWVHYHRSFELPTKIIPTKNKDFSTKNTFMLLVKALLIIM